MDLERSNKEGHMVISKLYGAKTDLQLEDMSPKSWHEYVVKMGHNQGMFEQFWEHYFRKGPSVNDSCDAKCKEDILCGLLTSESQLIKKPHVCEALKAEPQVREKRNFWWAEYLWGEE